MNTLMLVSKRNLKGYSQEQTAKMLGLSSVQYGKKERGEKDFKANEIKKLLVDADVRVKLDDSNNTPKNINFF